MSMNRNVLAASCAQSYKSLGDTRVFVEVRGTKYGSGVGYLFDADPGSSLYDEEELRKMAQERWEKEGEPALMRACPPYRTHAFIEVRDE